MQKYFVSDTFPADAACAQVNFDAKNYGENAGNF